MENHEKPNKIITSFLDCFENYDKNLKNRIRADNLFLGFDEKAKKDFSKFVKLSNYRYKATKSGTSLDDIIVSQRQKYFLLNKQLRKNILYNTSILNSEKSKLRKSVNEFQNKRIANLHDKIVNSLKDKKIKNNFNTSKDILEQEKNEKNNEVKLKNNEILNQSRNISGNLDDSENLADVVIKEDFNNFTKKMDSYHNLLSTAKNSTKTSENENSIKIGKSNFLEIESKLEPKNIKLLSFNDELNNKVNNNINKKDGLFDIRKLIKIKLNYDNNQKKFLNSFNKSKIHIHHKNLDTIQNYKSRNSVLKTKNNCLSSIENEKKRINYINQNGTKTFYNGLKDTMSLVKNEAKKGLFINEEFISKKNKFEDYFKKFYNQKLRRNKKKVNSMTIESNSFRNKSHNKMFSPEFSYGFDGQIKRIGKSIRILDDYLKLYDVQMNQCIREYKNNRIHKNRNHNGINYYSNTIE